jgi:hypothetical protein
MGIKPIIIHKDLLIISPKSFINYDSTYKPLQDSIVMCDLTCGIYTLAKFGQTQDERINMTGLELREVFNKRINNLGSYKGKEFAKIIILCLDKSKYIPKEKALEQESRHKGPYEGYSKDSIICDEGILQSQIINGILTSQFELINIYKLAKSSCLRLKLAEYLYNGITTDCISVIMDCWDKPRLSGRYIKLNNLPSNEIGEVDLQLMFWTKYFENENIIHITVDGDEIPITMSYIQKCGLPKKEWHWIQHWSNIPKKDKQVINLIQLYEDLTENSSFGSLSSNNNIDLTLTSKDKINLFLMYTFMFGTDYTRFDRWVLYVPHEKVWIALYRSLNYLNKMFDLWNESKYQSNGFKHDEEIEWMSYSIKVMEYVYQHILHVFTNEIKQPYKNLDNVICSKSPPKMEDLLNTKQMLSKKHPFPPEDPEEVIRKLRFNYLYWNNFIYETNEISNKKIKLN